VVLAPSSVSTVRPGSCSTPFATASTHVNFEARLLRYLQTITAFVDAIAALGFGTA
jgi:hypothetical protein